MSLKGALLKRLQNLQWFQSYLGKRTDDIGYAKLVKANSKKCRLTKQEKWEIKTLYGHIVPYYIIRLGYSFYEMTKALGDFNPYYLPSAYYMPYIFESLNLNSGLKVLGHKSLQALLFKEANQPKTVVSRISGVFYDNQFNQLTHQEAVEIIRQQTSDMILKPATDSSMGRGIRLIKSTDRDLDSLLVSLNDLIVQTKLRQSAKMSELNVSSLNCMRITTLNINNRVSATNRVVKIGAKGSIVDNIGAGSGGMMLGITEDGMVFPYGYRVDGSRVVLRDKLGTDLFWIPNFDSVIAQVLKWHKKIGSMGIIGWDIALDDKDHPVLIEANTYWPGITIEQIAAGPIFGDRTEEVIKFIKGKYGT